jgi:hypothetical protein
MVSPAQFNTEAQLGAASLTSRVKPGLGEPHKQSGRMDRLYGIEVATPGRVDARRGEILEAISKGFSLEIPWLPHSRPRCL